MAKRLGRRIFLTILAAGCASRPSSIFGQVASQTRLLGVVVGLANDAEMQARIKALEKALADRGWRVGENLRIVYRFADNDTQRMMQFAQEIVALRPDCILSHSTPVSRDLMTINRAIPVVFVSVSDPIGSGLVASMARPGGNMTGFTIDQPTITSKHLAILKQIAPRLVQVIALYNPGTAPGGGSFFLPSFMKAAPEFNIKPIDGKVSNGADIESMIGGAATEAATGMLVMPDNFTTFYRTLIISLAARFRVPAIYPYRYFVDGGGLLSLGVDGVDLFRRSADYVDRILRGASPSDLPVQRPIKVELAINLKTAKALELEVPRDLLAGADVVIE